MDFEFSSMYNKGIVLVAGAMSNSLDRFRVVKLEGNPLLLTKLHKVIVMSENMIIKAVLAANGYLSKKKTDKLQPLLKQYKQSIESHKNNLNIRTIRNYLTTGKGEAVLVFF